MKQRLKPLGNRVMVLPDSLEKRTPSGIIIPDTVKRRPLTGKVVDVGDLATEIAAGDHVLYGKGSGVDFEFEEVNYLILRSTDIFCTIEK